MSGKAATTGGSNGGSKRKSAMIPNVSTTPSTAVIRQLSARERRRKRKRLELEQKKKEPPIDEGAQVVCESFYEVAAVLGRRMRRGKPEYFIRWKGCDESQNTWEPAENLCDTALSDALQFARREKRRLQQMEQDERRLGLLSDEDTTKQEKNTTSKDNAPDAPPLHETHDETKSKEVVSVTSPVNDEKELQVESSGDDMWNWNETTEIKFQAVERIHVNDPDAANKTKEARVNGIPVVLVGHVGWVNFAKQWLNKNNQNTTLPEVEDSKNDGTSCCSDSKQMEKDVESSIPSGPDEEKDLDLTDGLYQLDMKRLMDGIGMEDVPVVRRDDTETAVHGVIKASKYLDACWPSAIDSKPVAKLFLEKWQFPLSDTAGRLLCHKSNPLPPDILGEDLLKHWLNLEQCKEENPLQYLSMGREETEFSCKLQVNQGGLDRTMAPIVGQKECILVHRADGAKCMYHLDAQVGDDLDTYPLLAQARMWKTTVEPGEILLLPQGTHFQCRNLVPCLEYVRLHLDSVNLLPFLQSMMDGDAPELDHSGILWNCTRRLIQKMDHFVNDTQSRVKSKPPRRVPPICKEIIQTVHCLRSLRHIVQEVARRDAVRKAVKVGVNCHQSSSMLTPLSFDTTTKKTDAKIAPDWNVLVQDLDLCLHEFRYRRLEKIPILRHQKIKALNNPLPAAVIQQEAETVMVHNDTKNENNFAPVVAYDTDLENGYMSLPKLGGSMALHQVLDPQSLQQGDVVRVQLGKRHAKGWILSVEPNVHAAYVSYEDYPSLYDEFQPCELLRTPSAWGIHAEIPQDSVKPGMVVMNKEEDRGIVQHVACETLYKVKVDVCRRQVERWFSVRSIFRIEEPKDAVATVGEVSAT
eukprot:scaffold421287_cov61-Attheya_sp.AAC.2